MRTIKTYRKVGAFYIAWEADFPTPIRNRLVLFAELNFRLRDYTFNGYTLGSARLAVRVCSCKPTSASANDVQRVNGALKMPSSRAASALPSESSGGSLKPPGNLHRYCQF